MNNTDLTIVYFATGNYSKEEDVIVWKSNDKLRPWALKTPISEVSYSQMVSGISKKLGIDEATRNIKMSYVPFVFNWEEPIYITEDDGVLGFLTNCKDQCRSILHVEIVKSDGSDGDERTNDSNSVRNEDADGFIGGDDEWMTVEAEDLGNEELKGDVKKVDEAIDLECAMDELGLGPKGPGNDSGSGVSAGGEWPDGLDIEVGDEFQTKEAIYDLIQKASHLNCFEYMVVKSDASRLVVRCREWTSGCKWAIRVAILPDSVFFSVRTYNRMHTCSRASTSTSKQRRKGTARLVAGMLQESPYAGRFDTPTPKTLVNLMQSKLGVSISYATAWRGRRRAANYVRGCPEESYGMLYSYLYTLEKMNPDTVWYVEVDEGRRFKYLFFALGACIEGWKVMRKVLIIDATHLNSTEGGVLAVVTAQDGNHHHYPIAFGVLDGEKDVSWSWFLSKLKTVVADMPELVFISDRNISIKNGIQEVFPLAKHGYCNYHLAQNVKLRCKTTKKGVVSKFLDCSKAYTESEFLNLYASFGKRYPSAAEYVEETCEKDKWARCYFPGDRYNLDSSNAVESINGVLLEARKLSVLPMIDAIVKKVAEWYCNRRKTSGDLLGTKKIVPYVDNILHNLCVEARTLTVIELNAVYLQFSVSGRNGHTFMVDLKMKTCACKRFDIDKYPCVHGIAAAIKAEINLETLCSKYYLVELWAMAYSQTIFLVPHSTEWIVPDEIRQMSALPPAYPKRKKRGRKPEKRITVTGEHGRRRKRRAATGPVGLEAWFYPVGPSQE